MLPTTHQTLPAIRPQPHASRCLASATQQVSRSSMLKHSWGQTVKWDWECTIECNWESTWEWLGGVLGSVLRAYLGAYSQAGWECAIECSWERPWEHSRECACDHLESVQSRKIGVCHREQLGASLRACLGVYLGASWELTGQRKSSRLGSLLSRANGSVLESMPGSVLRSVLRAYLRA